MIPTMSNPVCWRCINREVDAPGEVCNYCNRLGLGRRGEKLEDWSLEQLIDSQKSGRVPEGRRRWEEWEIPADPGYFEGIGGGG